MRIILRIMRKSSSETLFPHTRQVILAACALQPEKWWYLSDLALFLELTPSTLQRELASLTAAGILNRRKDGNRVYYQVNSDWPAIKDLQRLLIKTSGVADVVRTALKKFSDQISFAFIYGSIAKGEEIATSDIDLMLIGNLKLFELSSQLKRPERLLGREINPILFTLSEFKAKAGSNGFIKTVTAGPKIFLKGSADEFKEIIK